MLRARKNSRTLSSGLASAPTTHLLPQQSDWRWKRAVDATAMARDAHLNGFPDRDWMPTCADRRGMELIAVRGASEPVVTSGDLGQAICVLRRPFLDPD